MRSDRLRSEVCGCDGDQLSGTLSVSQAAVMQASINAYAYHLCDVQVAVALVHAAMVVLDTHGREPEFTRRVLDESVGMVMADRDACHAMDAAGKSPSDVVN